MSGRMTDGAEIYARNRAAQLNQNRIKEQEMAAKIRKLEGDELEPYLKAEEERIRERIQKEQFKKVYPLRYIPWCPDILSCLERVEIIAYSGGTLRRKPLEQSIVSQAPAKRVAGLPKIGDGYVLGPLRGGWLYLRHKKDGIWHEYQVDQDGTLRKCDWRDQDYGADIRPANGGSSRHLTLRRTSEYEIGYSETQWSWKLYETMEGDAALRSRVLQKLGPTTFGVGDAQHKLTPLADAQLMANADPSCDPVSTAYPRNGSEGEIVGIVDSLALADWLYFDLGEAWLKMKAMLLSMKYGVAPAECEVKLRQDPETNGAGLGDAHREQYLALHNLATLHYQLGFSTPEREKKIGKYLDRSRIETLLAVAARREIREGIATRRQNLLDYLASATYQAPLEMYARNADVADRILDAKQRLALHLGAVSRQPNAADLMLELPQDPGPQPGDDPGIGFIRAVADGCYPNILKLLDQEVTVKLTPEGKPVAVAGAEEGQDLVSLGAKLLSSLNGIFDASKGLVEEFPEYLTVGVRWLNVVRFKGDGMELTLFEQTPLQRTLQQGRVPIERQGKKVVRPTQLVTHLSETVIVTNRGILDVQQISLSRQFEQAFERNPTQVEAAIARLVDNPRWLRLMAGVSYLNLGLAVKNIYDTYRNEPSKAVFTRAIIDFVGNGVDALGARYSLKQALQVNPVDDLVKKQVVNTSTKFAVAGAFIGAGVSGFDAYMNLTEYDYDAAGWYGGSAVASVLLGIGLIANWSTIWIMILIGASTGTSFIAGFFEDPPLERMMKNFLLRRTGIQPPEEQEAWQSAIAHYIHREKLIEKRFGHFRDFSAALREMMEILFGLRVEFTPKWEIASPNLLFTTSQRVMCSTEIAVYFMAFTPGISRFSFTQLRFYREGLGKGYEVISPAVKGEKEDLIYEKTERGYRTVMSYAFSEAQVAAMTSESRVLFITRYSYSPSIAYPMEEKGKERYMAVLRKVRELQTHVTVTASPEVFGKALGTSIALSRCYEPDVRVGTLDEITASATWKE